ncbi:MAG: COQ9 family protein [Pseudomonadota bacterium]
MTNTDSDRLVQAAAPHVAFDGWSDATLRAALADADMAMEEARALKLDSGPRLAAEFHRMKDRELAAALEAADLGEMRFRDRITFAVRTRLELVEGDREAVRRAAALFALPINAPEGAKLVWETADLIWSTLGDTSEDYNWYTKRTILSGVYSATALYWLGDETDGRAATWEFLDRRISGVMQFEKVKAQVRDNRLLYNALWAPRVALSLIKSPGAMRRAAPSGFPGRGK